MDVIITTIQLQKAFGVTRIANLKKTLVENNVSFLVDRLGKPFTTEKALNVALGVDGSEKSSSDGFSLEHLAT